jgi:hypothetical protein
LRARHRRGLQTGETYYRRTEQRDLTAEAMIDVDLVFMQNGGLMREPEQG